MFENPDQLGGYQILEEVDRGAWGTVYRAHSTRLQRIVALRVLDPSLSRDQLFLRHLYTETQLIAKLEHDHVVRVYDVNEERGLHFIVMEYVVGGTLARLLKPRQPLPLPAACTVVRQAALALDHLQTLGLSPRDVNPGNVFLQTIPEQGGRVKLGDPGLARAALQGSVHTQGRYMSNMARYMSPEQARGETIDIRSNVYSLGVVAYEMLTGRTPFGDENLLCCIRCHAEEPPSPPARFNPRISQDVQDVILQALAKAPGQRFPSAGDLARELDAAAQRPFRPAPTEPPPPPPRIEDWEVGDEKRAQQMTRVLGWGVGLLVLLTCLLSAVVGTWLGASGLGLFPAAQMAQGTPLPRSTPPATRSPRPSATAAATAQLTTVAAITLRPASGPSGTRVLVQGHTFTPGDVVMLTWDGHVITPTQPTHVVVDASGQFQAAFYVPTDDQGGHAIAAGTAHEAAAVVFAIATGQIQPTATPTGSRSALAPVPVAWHERRRALPTPFVRREGGLCYSPT